MAVPYLACMALVAQLYHLPPRVLPSIMAVEGGTPGMISRNTNGTDDLGVMQINTIWLGPLQRITRLPVPLLRNQLINRPCFSIAAAGAIIRFYLDEEKGDLMRAVGDYHSHTPDLNATYGLKVMRSASLLFGPK